MILAADDHFGSYNNDSYNTDAFFGVAETRNFLEQLKDNFSKTQRCTIKICIDFHLQ